MTCPISRALFAGSSAGHPQTSALRARQKVGQREAASAQTTTRGKRTDRWFLGLSRVMIEPTLDITRSTSLRPLS